MAYFIGHGYSSAFSAHMAELLSELDAGRPVRLTVAADAVCGPCPNNTGGSCNKPSLVASYDRAVLAYTGLTEGEILPFGQFTALVQEKVLDRGLREKICGDCQWNGICANTPSRWQQNSIL